MTAAPPDKLFEANPYALPKDKGDIVIDGQKYPIYVPDYNGGPNANYHENGWSTVKTKYVSSSDTDWLAVIANLENESLDDSSNMSNKNIQDFCILSLILGFLQGYVNNTVTTYIHIEVQKKGSESHAIVQYGATNTILQSKAGFSYYYSDLKSVTDRNGVVWGKREAQNFVKEYFQCTDNKTYDIKVTLDSRHKTDKYIGYLSVNNEQVFLTPKLYSRDNAELGYFSISLDVINLNWKDYMNIRYLMEKPCLIPEVNIATINKMLVSNNIKFLS